MQRLTDNEPPPFDFWPYVDEIPSEDFAGYDCSAGTVAYVYRQSAGNLEHVLINSNDPNVFMAIVLDRQVNSVVGHHLLDLGNTYGITT